MAHDDMNGDQPGDGVNLFGSYIGHNERGWYVAARIDGQHKVISYHATRELATLAQTDLNASANPPNQ